MLVEHDLRGLAEGVVERRVRVVVRPEQLADELGLGGLTISEADPEQFLHVITRSPAPGPDRLSTVRRCPDVT